MPGFEHSTTEWQQLDAAHFLHPFTDFQALAAKGFVRAVASEITSVNVKHAMNANAASQKFCAISLGNVDMTLR